MYSRDRYIFPIWMQGTDLGDPDDAERIQFVDDYGVDVEVVWETSGFYYPMKDSFDQYPSLYTEFENLLNTAIQADPNWAGQLYEVVRATPQSQGTSLTGFLPNSGIILKPDTAGEIAYIGHPTLAPVNRGGKLAAALGCIPKVGSPWSLPSGLAYTDDVTALPGSIYGNWLSPVPAHDKRRRPVSDVMSSGPGKVAYTNVWKPQLRRHIEYRMVHSNHVATTPLRRREGPVTATYGGLLPFDQGNKFQSLWELGGRYGDIILVHDTDDSDSIDIRQQPFETGIIYQEPQIKTVTTDEGFSEHYHISFDFIVKSDSYTLPY